jgi:hypothetical protein
VAEPTHPRSQVECAERASFGSALKYQPLAEATGAASPSEPAISAPTREREVKPWPKATA